MLVVGLPPPRTVRHKKRAICSKIEAASCCGRRPTTSPPSPSPTRNNSHKNEKVCLSPRIQSVVFPCICSYIQPSEGRYSSASQEKTQCGSAACWRGYVFPESTGCAVCYQIHIRLCRVGQTVELSKSGHPDPFYDHMGGSVRGSHTATILRTFHKILKPSEWVTDSAAPLANLTLNGLQFQDAPPDGSAI